MKKTLVSALTTALVVGAASTTFAAANPFSDVPADHWAYDAVAQLAQDGVVNGYGDGTYRGQQNITRYEMAQIIAKAMAKNDVSAADKAMIDKLAAEFSDELNNLGVRVSNLEKKTDNVKWTGEIKYEYASLHRQDQDKKNAQRVVIRLNPQMAINDHWTANARIEYSMSANAGMNSSVGENNDGYGENWNNASKAWAQGQYGNTTIKLGRFGTFDYAGHGMIIDDNITGGEVTFGKDVKLQLAAGRYSWAANNTHGLIASTANFNYSDNTTSYLGAQVLYAKNKLDAGLGYHQFQGAGFTSANAYYLGGNKNFDGDKISIWDIGLGYKFTPTFYVTADYAKTTNGDLDSKFNHAYSIQANYKGADAAKKGSFGIFAAYRYLANATAIAATYDNSLYADQKGWELGTTYTFAPNIMGTVEYFTGKNFQTDTDQSRIFSKLEFIF